MIAYSRQKLSDFCTLFQTLNCLKTIPFTVAHTHNYRLNMGLSLPPPRWVMSPGKGASGQKANLSHTTILTNVSLENQVMGKKDHGWLLRSSCLEFMSNLSEIYIPLFLGETPWFWNTSRIHGSSFFRSFKAANLTSMANYLVFRFATSFGINSRSFLEQCKELLLCLSSKWPWCWCQRRRRRLQRKITSRLFQNI